MAPARRSCSSTSRRAPPSSRRPPNRQRNRAHGAAHAHRAELPHHAGSCYSRTCSSHPDGRAGNVTGTRSPCGTARAAPRVLLPHLLGLSPATGLARGPLGRGRNGKDAAPVPSNEAGLPAVAAGAPGVASEMLGCPAPRPCGSASIPRGGPPPPEPVAPAANAPRAPNVCPGPPHGAAARSANRAPTLGGCTRSGPRAGRCARATPSPRH